MSSSQARPVPTTYPLSFQEPAASWTLLPHFRPLFSIACSLFWQKQGGGVPPKNRFFRISRLQTLFPSPVCNLVKPGGPFGRSTVPVLSFTALSASCPERGRGVSAAFLPRANRRGTPNRPLSPL